MSQHRRSIISYTVAVASVAGAVLLVRLVPTLIERGALHVFLAAVVLTIWYGGWKPGVVAVLLSVTAGAWLLPPARSFAIDETDLLRYFLFLLVAVMIAALHVVLERTRAALIDSERRLRMALEAAHMGAWDYNLRTGEFWWSRSLARVLGYTSPDSPPSYEGFLGFIHPDEQKPMRELIDATIRRGERFEMRHRIIRSDGVVRWMVTRGQVSHDGQGNPSRIIGIAADTTELKEVSPLGAAP